MKKPILTAILFFTIIVTSCSKHYLSNQPLTAVKSLSHSGIKHGNSSLDEVIKYSKKETTAILPQNTINAFTQVMFIPGTNTNNNGAEYESIYKVSKYLKNKTAVIPILIKIIAGSQSVTIACAGV